MVEGGSSSDYRHVKTLMYARPDLMHRILAINADSVAAYLNAQIDAGAQAVMIFDSWGGVLADGAFQEFSLAYTARVLGQLKRTGADGQVVPRIVFTKGGGLWLHDMRALACDVLGLDWTMDLGRARAILQEGGGPRQGPAGQHRPNVLFARLRPSAEARRVLDILARRTPTPHAPAWATSSTWATASASSPRPSVAPGGRGACALAPAARGGLNKQVTDQTPGSKTGLDKIDLCTNPPHRVLRRTHRPEANASA
jgi:uroporphyrinogen decarboxylase